MFQIPGTTGLPDIRLDNHNSLWRFYRDWGDAALPEKPSSPVMAQLFRIVHDHIISFLDGHEAQISPAQVLELYQRYLDWRHELPDLLEIAGEDDQKLPHVLSLQYVQHLVLSLCRSHTPPSPSLSFLITLH